tara:strand:+ start:949 stop:1878 length:930 start_codon:yes stop_codon:yes gene_type:complete
MGWLRKKAKQIGNAFKKVGKFLKKGLGKIGKFFGKLGPLGSLALGFMFPGFGQGIFNFIKDIPGLGKVFSGVVDFAGKVGNTVYDSVTGAIQGGLDRIGAVFGKENLGQGFKTFVDNVTGLGEKTTETVTDTATDIVADTTTDAVSEQTIFGPLRENPKFSTEAVKEAVEEKTKGFFDIRKENPDLSFKESFKQSAEGKAYKNFNLVTKAGSIINQAEENEEYLKEMQAKNQASYFSTQGQALLSSTGVDNFSRSGTGMNFLDTSSFNPDIDTASQWRQLFGITSNIDPRDIPTYGYTFENYLEDKAIA